jgi:hypothetical protein
MQILGWIGLTCLAMHFFTSENPSTESLIFFLVGIMLMLFSKPINAKVKALADKLNAVADHLGGKEKHLESSPPPLLPGEDDSAPFVSRFMPPRDLNKEAWCWYHRSPEAFFNGALDACQAVVDFFIQVALKRGMSEFERNSSIYDKWSQYVREFTEGIKRARFGDYQAIYDAAQSLESNERSRRQSIAHGCYSSNWLEDADPEEYERLVEIASHYAGYIVEGLETGHVPPLQGGQDGAEDRGVAPPD